MRNLQRISIHIKVWRLFFNITKVMRNLQRIFIHIKIRLLFCNITKVYSKGSIDINNICYPVNCIFILLFMGQV